MKITKDKRKQKDKKENERGEKEDWQTIKI